MTAKQLRETLGARGNSARCPAHEDTHASLSIGESPDGKILLKCHAGCEQSAVIQAMQARGLWPAASVGLTVAKLAADKRLPEALLRESGFADDEGRDRSVVRMRYRGADGEVLCTRYRSSSSKDGDGPRFWFQREDKQQLFGLWRLKAEPVILVEGETDSIALWAAGFNAIGCPGADAWNDARFAPLVEQCPIIYVHVEPDAGGKKFRRAMVGSRLRDRVRFFTVTPPAKDPCELHARDPDGFREAINRLLEQATPAVQEAESGELPPGVSDDALALRFTERHAVGLRYVAAWDRWHIWDGKRWAHDEKRRTWNMARALCRHVLTEQLANPLTEARERAVRNRLGSAQTVYAVVRLASSDPRHAVSIDQLDADPWVLNTPGGIVDLRTGEIRPNDPATLCTKITAAAPAGECPLFLSVLKRAQPDVAVREYIQRLAGYGMTGSAREHIAAFWHGGGANSKGTIAHAIRHALGEYGLEIPAETLMESHNDRHPTEIAVLRGARFVIGSEIDLGRRWNESRLKRLTGGDPISARYIGKDLFEFEPSHALLIVGNSKPGLRQVDEAIRRRMHLLEWSVTIPDAERDPTIPDRLQAEYGGILAWMLAGCLHWQSKGLAPPSAVTAATSAYLAGEDMLQAWIDECCTLGGQITLTAAHRLYREWCERNGAVVLGRNNFGDQLEAHGFVRGTDSHSKAVVFAGLSVPVRKARFPDSEDSE